MERNVDESKGSRRYVAAIAARVWGRVREGRSRLIDEVCEQWKYSRKHAIKLLAAKAGWGEGLIPERVGRVFSNRSHPRASRKKKTPRMEWNAWRRVR